MRRFLGYTSIKENAPKRWRKCVLMLDKAAYMYIHSQRPVGGVHIMSGSESNHHLCVGVGTTAENVILACFLDWG